MNMTNTPFKIHNENAGIDTRVKQSGTGNVPMKAGLGVPQSTRKALGHLSSSNLNTRQTPSTKQQTLGSKDISSFTTKPKVAAKPQMLTVVEVVPDYDPNDLITFGRSTVIEDPYDIVQRLAKTRAKTGKSLIFDSELDQDILAERRRAAEDDVYVRQPEPFEGINDTEYLDDLMSSFMEFDD